MKKVLFIIPSLEAGGAERVFATLAASLDSSRFAAGLVLATKSSTGPHFAVPPPVRVHELGCKRVRRAFWPLARLLGRERPHAVCSTLAHMNMLVLLLKVLFFPRLRVLVREGSIASRNIEGEPHARLTALAYRWLYRRADRVICQSEAMRADLCSHYDLPERQCTVLRNPVDFDAIDAAVSSPSPYAAHGPGPHIVFLGRLDAVKRADLVLKAFAESMSANTGAHLWLVGEGGERAALERLAADLPVAGRIHFCGLQADPRPWLAHADLFVLASRHEGLPNALLEALAAGCRVQVLRHPGGSLEILRLAGLEEAFVDRLDFPAALRQDRPGAQAARRLRPHFAREIVAAHFMDLLECG